MRALILAGLALCQSCRAAGHEPSPAEMQASAAAPSPQLALDQLDRRHPVPLLPIMAQHQKESMREHLEAVQGVVAAAATGDFAQVAASAKRMGSSETMGRMCEHMGAGAPGFTERALTFHRTADEIAAAAVKQDGPAVLMALSKTLQTCTGCHATYKQQVVATVAEHP